MIDHVDQLSGIINNFHRLLILILISEMNRNCIIGLFYS